MNFWAEASSLVDNDPLLSKGGEGVERVKRGTTLGRVPLLAGIPLPDMVLTERWSPGEIWLTLDNMADVDKLRFRIQISPHLSCLEI